MNAELSNKGFLLLALNLAKRMKRDWYVAMLNNAKEEVFDKLRQDIKGDIFAAWCELINLHLANKYNVICANPMVLLRGLENDKSTNTIRMEELTDDLDD